MGKSKTARMKGLSVQACRDRASVELISDQWMINRCHMDTDLMGSTSMQSASNQAPLITVLKKLYICSGQLSWMLSHINHSHPQPVTRIPAHGRIDFTRTCTHPRSMGQCEILATDLSCSD